MVELGEVLKYEQPTKYIVKSAHYDDKNAVPVLTAGKSFILGYTNEKHGIFPREKLPIIIFDDFTTAIKFVDFPFKVKSSAMKILHADRQRADVRFLFYAMQQIVFPVRRHKRHWISEYSKIKIQLPPFAEQKRIVKKLDAAFTLLEQLVNLFARQKTSFANLRASVLNEAFALKPQVSPALVPAQVVVAPKIFDIQQAVALILKRFERGEMVVAKLLYLAQKIYQVPLGIQFSAQNFGPYDRVVKKAVTAGLSPRNKFFTKKGFGNTQVLSLGSNANKILKYANSALARKMNGYLDATMPYFSKSDSNSIERLATICKIIEDEKTTDDKIIKAKLQEWKPNKFQDPEVSRTIAFIKKHKWDAKLIT